MDWKRSKLLIIVLSIWVYCNAQDKIYLPKYNEKTNEIITEELNYEKWKEINKNHTFNEASDSLKKPKKEQQKKKTDATISNFNFGNLKYLWIFLAIALILFVLYKLKINKQNQANIFPINDLDINQIEEQQLKTIDFLKLYEQAIKENKYNNAFRYRYLHVLQLLYNTNKIQFKQHLTNYDYLQQLLDTNIYDNFKRITHKFDDIWYGNKVLNQLDFESELENFNIIETQI